jgi:hypothetical protein
MKNKLFIFSALIISAFIFSACTVKDQTELKTDQNLTEVNQETGDETEAELLKQIDADTDTNFDADFKNLETELNK